MSGNVFEWCLNLASGPEHIDLRSPDRRSLRGGSWAHSAEHARADFRYANRPMLRRNRVGFRLLRLI
jgi:formylglycine-generating enzyme required for sulfatase activity